MFLLPFHMSFIKLILWMINILHHRSYKVEMMKFKRNFLLRLNLIDSSIYFEVSP
uniref:Uncharacterized protein n=1 Tax=Solanum lycopersicum TaxID=4081 RepID=K4CJI5_SOLLC